MEWCENNSVCTCKKSLWGNPEKTFGIGHKLSSANQVTLTADPWPYSAKHVLLDAFSYLNQLMLAETKRQPNNFDEIFPVRRSLEKYLKEKCRSEYSQKFPFKYFAKSFLISKLSLKSFSIQTIVSKGTLKHQSVKVFS